MSNHQYFITGIGTDIGKTFISSILVKGLNAHYWKPIQSGTLEGTDSKKVQTLTSLEDSFFIPSVYALEAPVSPHEAAKRENVSIQIHDFVLPSLSTPLIVEGAGGVLVPINETETVLDLAQQLGLPLIIVSQHYLGSINHTLLTLMAIQSKGLPIKGIIFNGHNAESERIILQKTQCPYLGTIPTIDKTEIHDYTLLHLFKLLHL